MTHKCSTCGGDGLVISPKSGCFVPCPICTEGSKSRFQPKTITDEEAALVQQMTPEERAYLRGRLVEREGPDTPEDRAALFNEMRRIISERRYGSPYSVAEIRKFLAASQDVLAERERKLNRQQSRPPREAYLLEAADWLCQQVETFEKRAKFGEEKTYNATIAELPDDPPGGYTLPHVRAMRQRIDDLESEQDEAVQRIRNLSEALCFYADNKNYESEPGKSSPVFIDYGVIARDVLHNPKKKL